MSSLLKATEGVGAHAVARAGLSMFPIFGGAAVELFQAVIQPPLEKRRIAWMNDVGERLQRLEESAVSLEDLQNNEHFISMVMHASQIALKTHQEEKLTALRNAVLNSVAPHQAMDESEQYIFHSFVDSLSGFHIQILRIFQNPKLPGKLIMGGLSRVLEHNLPELRRRRYITDQLWRDLYLRGLVKTGICIQRCQAETWQQNKHHPLGNGF
jgi:hypothetical protein